MNSGRRGLESRVAGLDELRAGVGVRYIIGGGRLGGVADTQLHGRELADTARAARARVTSAIRRS